ncbi:MAG: helix-turn-helix transcriptional regulator [Pseudomonadota bacterium]
MHSGVFSGGVSKTMQLDPMEWANIGLQAEDAQTAWQTAVRQLNDLGVEQAGLVYNYPLFERTFPGAEYVLGTIVNSDWEDFCRAEAANSDDFFDIATPSSLGLQTYINPQNLMRSGVVSPHDKKTIADLYENGLSRGWTTPVLNKHDKRVSVLLLSTTHACEDFDRFLARHANSVDQCITFFVEALDLKQQARQQASQSTSARLLSPREQECLLWASVGLSTKEISARLNLADSTIAEYFKNAAHKLKARNRTHAVARAIMLGLIRP